MPTPPDELEAEVEARRKRVRRNERRIVGGLAAGFMGLTAFGTHSCNKTTDAVRHSMAVADAQQEPMRVLKAMADDLGSNESTAYFSEMAQVEPTLKELKDKAGAAVNAPPHNREIAPAPRMLREVQPVPEEAPDPLAKELAGMVASPRGFQSTTAHINMYDQLLTELTRGTLGDEALAELVQVMKSPRMQPDVLVAQARQSIIKYLNEARMEEFKDPIMDHPGLKKLLGEEDKKPANWLEKAQYKLDLAKLMLEVRKKPDSVTQQQHEEMLKKLGSYIEELARQQQHKNHAVQR